MEKEKVIELIAGRIIDEYRKHNISIADWNIIAAAKIYSQWIEYFKETNKWISVNDEMPANRQKVMIFYNYENRKIVGCGSLVLNETETYWQSGAATQMNVTHWMPLPNAPISTTEA